MKTRRDIIKMSIMIPFMPVGIFKIFATKDYVYQKNIEFSGGVTKHEGIDLVYQESMLCQSLLRAILKKTMYGDQIIWIVRPELLDYEKTVAMYTRFDIKRQKSNLFNRIMNRWQGWESETENNVRRRCYGEVLKRGGHENGWTPRNIYIALNKEFGKSI